MAQPPVLKFDKLISVQATYPTNVTSAGVLTCDDVIKIPLGYAVRRHAAIDYGAYSIIPVVELDIPIDFHVFEIITNEGVTVEPFSTKTNPYDNVRSYFVLPPRNNGN